MDNKAPEADRNSAGAHITNVFLFTAAAVWIGVSHAQTNITVVTDPIGEKWEYVFEENLRSKNLVSRVSQTDGKGVAQEFDENNNLISRTDAAGRTTSHSYNVENQRISTTVAAGTPEARTTTYEYLSPGVDLPAVVTMPSVFSGADKTVTTRYDVDLNVTSVTIDGYDPKGNPVSRVTRFAYNDLGQVTQIDGPRTDVNDVTTRAYYQCSTGAECGQLASVTNTLGHTTTYDAYDANGRLLQMTDPNGLVTTFTYHPRGWVESVVQNPPDGDPRVTSYDYDGLGQMTSATTPDGIVLIYSYDAAHELRRITDSLGNSVEYSYDLKGNRVEEKTRDPDGTLVRSMQWAYDIRDHVTAINRGQGGGEPGSITRMVKDAVGNLVSETDPNMNPGTTHDYDALDRLTRTLDALSNPTRYGYDEQDNLARVTAPNGALTKYEYDDLGNLLQEVSPDRGTVTRSYDAAGNLVTETDARGVTTTFTYDALNRITGIDYPGTEEDVTYVYDRVDEPGACAFGKGRLCEQTDNGGTRQYQYDVYGNVVEVRHTVLGQTYVMSYEYDAGNRTVGMTYPGGRKIDIARDALGRIRDLSTTVEGEATRVLSNRTYRADGLNTSQAFGNGLTGTRAYDLQGRLVHQTVSTATGRSYDYDANGNLLTITDADGSRAYFYDALDRLLGADYDVVSLGYDYDANSNRLSLVDNGTMTPYTYTPESNRLEQVGAAAISLDAAGNTLADQDGNRRFEYNQAGRLAAVNENGIELARYGYDFRGLRIKKTVADVPLALKRGDASDRAGRKNGERDNLPDTTTVYHYGRDGRLLVESTDSGVVYREYLYADGHPVAMIVNERFMQQYSKPASPGRGAAKKLEADSRRSDEAPERIFYYHTDHLGTPQFMTDADQAQVWRAGKDPFGDDAPIQASVENNLRFPGQYYDQETGLHYNWNRYYDPSTGRYVTSDPIGLDGGLNTFSYVLGNPLRWIDSNGLEIVGKWVDWRLDGFPDFAIDGYDIGAGYESGDISVRLARVNFRTGGRIELLVRCIETECGEKVRAGFLVPGINIPTIVPFSVPIKYSPIAPQYSIPYGVGKWILLHQKEIGLALRARAIAQTKGATTLCTLNNHWLKTAPNWYPSVTVPVGS